MTLTLKTKELVNTKLANNYGGWIYCSSCNQTIGYLCYVAYHHVTMEYNCKCGSKGSVRIEKEGAGETIPSPRTLTIVKNRSCCPECQAPLITILKQKMEHYSYKIVCKNCNHEYSE